MDRMTIHPDMLTRATSSTSSPTLRLRWTVFRQADRGRARSAATAPGEGPQQPGLGGALGRQLLLGRRVDRRCPATASARAGRPRASPGGRRPGRRSPSRGPRGDDRRGQPEVGRLPGSDEPAGRTDLERPRIPDEVDQRPGAAEVRDEPELGLPHTELRVVGQQPQVGGERQLEPGTDRVALDRRDDHRRHRPPDGEPALEAARWSRRGRRRRRRARGCRALPASRPARASGGAGRRRTTRPPRG